MSPVNSMFVCIKKKIYIYIYISANLFLKWPISIIGKMLNIGTDNRSTPRWKPNRTIGVRTELGLPVGVNICNLQHYYFFLHLFYINNKLHLLYHSTCKFIKCRERHFIISYMDSMFVNHNILPD